MTLGAFAIVAVFILALSLGGSVIDRSPITPPMLSVAVGLSIALVGGSGVAFTLEGEEVLLIAEVTLILLLFTDATRISSTSLKETGSLPIRLLLVGLPLTALLGIAATSLILTDLTWTQAGLVALIVTPTDAALGQAVVSNPAVPARIRHALEVESGLNDGMVVPAIGIFLALVERAELGSRGEIAFDALGEIVIGAAIGALGGWLFGTLGIRALSSGFTDVSRMRMATLAGSAATVGGAIALGGNGFIAAFCAGLALRASSKQRCDSWTSLPENLGQLGTIVAFVAFGATMVKPALEALTWRIGLTALVLLTICRMLPVAIALIGSKLQWVTVAFIGWFGPRGLASILFALILTSETSIEESEVLASVITVVILCSVILHGLSAGPFANRYGQWLSAHPKKSAMPEHDEVPEQRPRAAI